jgi:hypothetical protein
MHLPIQIFTGKTSLGAILVWLAAGAFLAGGIANATGHQTIRAGFERLGFPAWWCWVTAALETATALLLIGSGTRYFGLALGACIMLAAIAAVLRIRRYRELPPPLVFLLLLILAGLGGYA